MNKILNLIPVAVMIITACQSKTVSDDMEAIRNIQDHSVAAVRAKDINKIISIYTKDAIEMPPNEPIAIGIEAIKKGWELWFADTTYLHNKFTETIDNIEVSASGDLGYIRTTSHIFIKTTNGTIEQEEKNIYIYKKKGGEWKCIIAIWNNKCIPDAQEGKLKREIKKVENNGASKVSSSEFDQFELMKQFIGSWKADYAEDTTAFWNAKSYGTGLECDYKFVSKGKTVKQGKQLWGYDSKTDKYVAASLPEGMELEIDVYWFTSKNRCEALIYHDINDPEKASLKWVIKFKSPDKFIETVTETNKPDRTITYSRVK